MRREMAGVERGMVTSSDSFTRGCGMILASQAAVRRSVIDLAEGGPKVNNKLRSLMALHRSELVVGSAPCDDRFAFHDGEAC